LEWALQCEADFLKAFAAKGRLDTDSAKGTSTFQVTDFKPQSLQAFFLPTHILSRPRLRGWIWTYRFPWKVPAGHRLDRGKSAHARLRL